VRSPGLPSDCFREDRFLATRPLFEAGSRQLCINGVHPLRLPLPLAAPELDLSAWDGLWLTVTNRSAQPLAVGLQLRHAGSSRAVSDTGGRETLLPDTPRQLFFPWSGFGSYGRPEGFRRVAAIEVVFRRERDQAGPLALASAASGLCAVSREAVSGPRLAAEGLSLVLRRPVAEALGTRDFPAYAVLPELLAVPAPIFPYPPDAPAAVRRGRVMGHDVGLPPDWDADPHGELEWRHFLHRHHFLRVLQRGGDGPVGIVPQVLEDWIVRHPVPLDSDGGAGPSFETLSVAWRLREWISILAAIWNQPTCASGVKSLLLRSVWEQARHLCDHRGHPGNWRLIEAAALALAGLVFPEFREAPAWATLGLARLEDEAKAQFLTDGFHVERSPLYHGICAQACLEVCLAAREAGRSVPGVLERGLGRWFPALAALARPDRTWPSLNDSGSADRDCRPLLRLARKALGSGGCRVGSAPVLLPETGFAVLRRDRTYALLKAGPRPPAHAHDDDMAVEVCLDGRPVLVDPGISRYAPSVLTDAYRSAAAHSCLLAGTPFGRAEGISLLRNERLQVASATRRVGGMMHRRDVCLLDTGSVVIRDVIVGAVGEALHFHWQFAPGPLRLGRRTGAARGDGFRFIPLLGRIPYAAHLRRGRENPPAGFVSLGGRDVVAAHLEYACSPDCPCSLWWVFLTAGSVRQTRSGLVFAHANGTVSRLSADPWTLLTRPARRTT
jgi:hypothetical protein